MSRVKENIGTKWSNSNICIMGILEEEESGQGIENPFEKNNDQNLP